MDKGALSGSREPQSGAESASPQATPGHYYIRRGRDEMTNADLHGALSQIRGLLNDPGPMPRKAAIGMLDNVLAQLSERITPEWCVNMARLEDGHEVGAGIAALDPLSDCPHAAPHRYCETCKVSPCPIGLGAPPPSEDQPQ